MYYSQKASLVAELLNHDPALAEVEDSNFQAAVEHCQETQNWELLLKFTKALGQYWSNSGGTGILEGCIRSLLHGDLENGIERADALGMLAEIKETQGDYSEARLHVEQEISILERLVPKDLGRLNRALRQAVSLARLRKYDG
jgi:hypothetical protein